MKNIFKIIDKVNLILFSESDRGRFRNGISSINLSVVSEPLYLSHAGDRGRSGTGPLKY